MGTVDNGGFHKLLIEKVHSGTAGSEVSADGALTVAFKPNSGRASKALVGSTARLDGVAYRIASFAESAVTAGFVRIQLQEVA